jgi:replicative DNA helicase
VSADPLRYTWEQFHSMVLSRGGNDEDARWLWELHHPPTGGETVGPQRSYRSTSGDNFILGPDEEIDCLWGHGETILWAAGEPLLICGPDGCGKTTIAQQLALARMGLGNNVLGYPVEKTDKRLVYLAADRPRQAKRSWKRMVEHEEAEFLRDHLTVISGGVALPDIPAICADLDAGTVVIDTLSAVAPGDLSTDQVGLDIYHALQSLVAASVEVLVLHHPRKQGEHRRGLEEVHGSRWITAPCGSILLLSRSRKPFMRHVKSPANPAPGIEIEHDHRIGRSRAERVYENSD